jgi:HEAT repeat protein
LAEPTISQVRYLEPDPSGSVRIVVEETRQRVLSGRLDEEPIRHLLLAAAREARDPGLRGETVDILKAQPEAADVRRALLATFEHDPNDGVRLKALEGLKSFATEPDVRSTLVRSLLVDDNPGIRIQAIDLLIQKREDALVGVLQELMQRESNNYVRLRCQRALQEMNASVGTF